MRPDFIKTSTILLKGRLIVGVGIRILRPEANFQKGAPKRRKIYVISCVQYVIL